MDAVVYIHTLSRSVLVPFLRSPDQHFDSLTVCFWYYVYLSRSLGCLALPELRSVAPPDCQSRLPLPFFSEHDIHHMSHMYIVRIPPTVTPYFSVSRRHELV